MQGSRKSLLAVIGSIFLVSNFFGLSTPVYAHDGAHEVGASDPFACSGRVRTTIENYLEEGKSYIRYQLTCKRRRLKLQIDGEHKPIPMGSYVTVKGKKLRGKNTLRVALDGDGSLSVRASESSALVGPRTALIIIAKSQDADTPPCSETQLADYLFTNTVSTSAVYSRSSYGAAYFRGDGDANGKPDVVTVTIPYATAGKCDQSVWNSSARSLASTLVDLSKFNHKLVVLPSNVSCGWAGYASIGGDMSIYHGANCSWQPELFAHELGHNFGAHHSSVIGATAEYLDHSCVMGNPGGPNTFNAAKRAEQGWLSGSRLGVGAGSYVLANLNAEPLSGQVNAVKINAGALGSYYIAYRQRGVPEEGGLKDDYHAKVSVTSSAGSGSISRLHKTLVAGESFSDPTVGATITVNSIDSANQTAAITVQTSCLANPPSLSFVPTLLAGAPGGTKSITLTVKNNDNAACDAATFSLSTTVPSGWSASSSPSSLVVNAGASASATVNVTIPSSAGEGSYSLSATAARGSAPSGSANANFLVDITNPSPPTAVSATSIKSGKRTYADVVCSGAIDTGLVQSGIAGHQVLRNGVLVCTVSGSTCRDQLSSTGTYVYTCIAVDGAGRLSAPSSASATVVVSSSKGRR